MFDIIIIGAGASGLFCSNFIESNNSIILEKNSFAGKKLNITGKGRCNITNTSNSDIFHINIFSGSKFLYSSLNEFSNLDTINYFNKIGVSTKVERGNRVFPSSDKAKDVTEALLKNIKTKIKYNINIEQIKYDENVFTVKTKNEEFKSKILILATGGVSYPATGSDGNIHDTLINNLDISLSKLKPALCGLNTKIETKNLSGLTLKNVNVSLKRNKKVIKSEFGELLFTHFGLSGPTILRLSPFVEPGDKIIIDLKPALDFDMLNKRLLRDINNNPNKNLKNILELLLPKKLIDIVSFISKIDIQKKVSILTKNERESLIIILKNLEFDILSRRGFNESVITDGGVKLNQINPKTMQFKNNSNLFIIGELLDVAANTGGYNLQIAFSTAFKAAKYANLLLKEDKCK